MTDRRKPVMGALLMGALLLGLVGCGSRRERGEVDGTLICNGKPLGNVLVTFVPDTDQGLDGPNASGVTDLQGQFRLRGADQIDGAFVGLYRVIVEDLNILNAERSPDGTVLRAPPVRFHSDYGSLLKSPLRQQVSRGAQIVQLSVRDSR